MPQEDDCACNVTNDVTSVGLDTKGNKAQKDCAENEIVANNVTPMKKNYEKNQKPQDCSENEDVTNDVTPVRNDDNDMYILCRHTKNVPNE